MTAPANHLEVKPAVSNGNPPVDLPLPETSAIITENLLKLTQLAPDPRIKFIFARLITHLHQFINETSITTDEWTSAITFLTRVGQTCTPLRQEFILLSDVLGVSALVDAISNPPVAGGTQSSLLGPFFTDDAPEIKEGDSIASEGKGELMYVEGRVCATDGTPIPNATIDTWEADELGFYDTQYDDRTPDCRGRLKSGADGSFGYRAVVPVAYPTPEDGPVGELLLLLNRHNMRPNHLHLIIAAPGYKTLVTALYPDGDKWLASDAVFGVKKSLVVHLKDVNDDEEASKRGFPKGGSFKLLQRDIILVREEDSKAAYDDHAQRRAAAIV